MCLFNVLLVTELYARQTKYLKNKSNAILLQVNQSNLPVCLNSSNFNLQMVTFRFQRGTVPKLHNIEFGKFCTWFPSP